MPPSLAAKPLLSQFEREYYNHFWFLSQSRHWDANGPMAIGASELQAHLNLNSIHEQSIRSDMLIYIRAMDSKWLELMRGKISDERKKAEAESKRKAAQAKAKSGRRRR